MNFLCTHFSVNLLVWTHNYNVVILACKCPIFVTLGPERMIFLICISKSHIDFLLLHAYAFRLILIWNDYLWDLEYSNRHIGLVKYRKKFQNHDSCIYIVFYCAYFDAGNSTPCATGAGLPTSLQLAYCFLSIYRWNS